MRTLLIPATTHGRILVRSTSRPGGVLVGFHGYAEDAETQMARLERVPGTTDWTLVSIQGLHRFYRGRSEIVVSGWMVRQDRETLIADNLAYVDAALVSVGVKADEVRLKADQVRLKTNTPGAGLPIVFSGFSQGVAMAFRAAVRGRFRAAGVIAVGGDVPPELLADPDADFPPVLLMRGRTEEWYSDEKMRRDLEALALRGVAVTPVVYDGGHEWTDEVSAAAGRFLDREWPA